MKFNNKQELTDYAEGKILLGKPGRNSERRHVYIDLKDGLGMPWEPVESVSVIFSAVEIKGDFHWVSQVHWNNADPKKYLIEHD